MRLFDVYIIEVCVMVKKKGGILTHLFWDKAPLLSFSRFLVNIQFIKAATRKIEEEYGTRLSAKRIVGLRHGQDTKTAFDFKCPS